MPGDSDPCLVASFLRRCDETPERPLLTFLDDDGGEQARFTFAEMGRQAGSIAGFLLTQCRLRPGDRVLLVYPPSADFVRRSSGPSSRA